VKTKFPEASNNKSINSKKFIISFFLIAARLHPGGLKANHN
jgi:hypothetical protein